MFNNQRTKRTFRFFDRAVSALNFVWFADYSYLLFARQPLFFTFLKLFLFCFVCYSSGPTALFFFVYLRSSALQRSALYADQFGMSNIFFTFSSFFSKNLQKMRFSAGFKNRIFENQIEKCAVYPLQAGKIALKAPCI